MQTDQKNPLTEKSHILVIFNTFDQMDEEKLPKRKNKDNLILRTPSNSDPRSLCALLYIIYYILLYLIKTKTKTNTILRTPSMTL